MSENDIIAEYVKEQFPELLHTFNFAMWRMGKILLELQIEAKAAFLKIDFSDLNKKIEKVNKAWNERMLK